MDSIEDRIDLVDGAFWGRNPHDELAWLRANAPVWRDPRTGVWGVATYDLVKYVSTRPELFSNAGGIRPDQDAVPMMIDMDDPAHWKHRKLVNKGFTPKRVGQKEASIRQIVDVILDGVCERGTCDLVQDIAAWLPLIVIADELGVDPADRAQLLQWSEDMMGALGQRDEEAMQRAARAGMGYYAYAQRVIDSRRERPTEDLMSILVHAEVDGDRLEDSEIISESLLVLNGGDETTRHVISGGVYELLRAPANWEALRRDRALIPAAVEEMLRWVSPIKNMARTATTDLDLAGQRIAAGDTLLLLYPSANRDEAVFKEPFRFDIRRSPNEHVAFGFGAHYCLGTNLARLELRVVLDRLLDRMPDLALVNADEPKHRAANFVSGYESVPVRFTPTRPLGVQAVHQ
ncbi:cytochrome P450 [Frankia sp. AgB1.9]|uniref:cytochrome P450 n=1 Tax=unclassified Frankia TaxID=2632575 RepID=UPI0019344D82|nr:MULTISPECIES: cytochrome P450 [unclassified Frankia]MBL7487561.1 cytochrome P450 [Frankia sp. AgW1.1]MBL7549533.1 cytochrome P450 [Frankia sp. AgB1.9]MBL7620678.1 cytochrome P450 [Frankia sp. AgB1.8]